jgi:ionotropic glutamate receptor NMDA 1
LLRNIRESKTIFLLYIFRELKAFIWDSPVLYHESSKDCSLTTAGELFGRSAYGIGLPKDSPWTDEVSLAILNFHESGKMEALETAWIDIGNCPESSNAPATLGLSHMLGKYILQSFLSFTISG